MLIGVSPLSGEPDKGSASLHAGVVRGSPANPQGQLSCPFLPVVTTPRRGYWMCPLCYIFDPKQECWALLGILGLPLVATAAAVIMVGLPDEGTGAGTNHRYSQGGQKM